MERCPICRARLQDDPVCYRCSTDLAIPLRVEKQATVLEQQAAMRIKQNDYAAAVRTAQEALSLRYSPLAVALLGFAKTFAKTPAAVPVQPASTARDAYARQLLRL